jgi:hypothetical protein
MAALAAVLRARSDPAAVDALAAALLAPAAPPSLSHPPSPSPLLSAPIAPLPPAELLVAAAEPAAAHARAEPALALAEALFRSLSLSL